MMSRNSLPEIEMRPCLTVLLAMTLIGSAAQAQLPAGNRVQIHAFGNWAYGRTDGNHYLSGNHEGSYENMSFALNTSAAVSDRLRIVTQVFWEESGEGNELGLDYAFAGWRLGTRMEFRAGKVKMPFGLSSETFDVGTLRPFNDLPPAVYGGVGFLAEGFKGIALTGTLPAPRHWDVSYDLYGGSVQLPTSEQPIRVFMGIPDSSGESEPESMRDVIGTRVIVATPIAGLRLGVSAFSGWSDADTLRRQVVAGLAEYSANGWQIRAELAHTDETRTVHITGGYVQASWYVTQHWQTAVLYDRLTTRVDGANAAAARSLLDHEEWGVGLNYWLDPSFVLKSSVHRVVGNRFAGPAAADMYDAAQNGTLRSRTSLFTFGAAFAF